MAEKTAAGRGRMIERVRTKREEHKQRGRTYRVAFGTAGFTVLLAGGVLALPFVPGPGLLLVVIGLGMLALEFAWAERLLERALDQLEKMGDQARSWSTRRRIAVGAVTVLAVAAVVGAALVWDVPGLPF